MLVLELLPPPFSEQMGTKKSYLLLLGQLMAVEVVRFVSIFSETDGKKQTKHNYIIPILHNLSQKLRSKLQTMFRFYSHTCQIISSQRPWEMAVNVELLLVGLTWGSRWFWCTANHVVKKAKEPPKQGALKRYADSQIPNTNNSNIHCIISLIYHFFSPTKRYTDFFCGKKNAAHFVRVASRLSSQHQPCLLGHWRNSPPQLG